jgi:hypothetical protein
MPRLDYSNGSCPSLLLEPSRTNLITYSEYFGGSYWTKSGSSVVSGFTSPDSTNNAFKLVEDTSTGLHKLQKTSINVSAGAVSCYYFVKKAERSKVLIELGGGGGGYATFDLDLGTLIVENNVTAKIELISNGWYRCSVSYITSETSIYTGAYLVNDSGTQSYTGNGTSGLYVYGAQIEQGSYPTSYIPTYGVSQTRLSEFSAFELSVLDFFSLGTSESGTFLIETKYIAPSSQAVVDTFSQGGSGTNAWSGSNFQIRDTGGSTNFSVQYIASIIDDFIKIIIRKDGTTYNVFVNGVKSSTTATITNPLKWFDHIGLYRNSQKVKQMMEFPTALSDEACIELTTI